MVIFSEPGLHISPWPTRNLNNSTSIWPMQAQFQVPTFAVSSLIGAQGQKVADIIGHPVRWWGSPTAPPVSHSHQPSYKAPMLTSRWPSTYSRWVILSAPTLPGKLSLQSPVKTNHIICNFKFVLVNCFTKSLVFRTDFLRAIQVQFQVPTFSPPWSECRGRRWQTSIRHPMRWSVSPPAPPVSHAKQAMRDKTPTL